ncbi:MAG TPA: 23S rRNA (adenine(2503)-C(2))-methyltransferase RlmN [Solirubrobacteraceae bacterium]|jgi:23S rRNA (adenine2503-C2)-methyltransferase|nr:23S rRNA (adenine(2503)-C(2))-methyltransferase RlmN [Solirubrobacteraceae bacterium]
MDLELLERTLTAHGQPPFRARQVWRWASRGAGSWAEMTDLPAELRETLAREIPLSSLETLEEAHSRDGTVKALFRTADGRSLEAVLMRYRDTPKGTGRRRSVCLSSQSGCPLTCSFCATGRMRFARNLTASEILDQALHFRRLESVPLTNCVFMGMGEPMLNLDAVLAACERLPDIGITHRHTTISTVGWIPGIERLAHTDLPVRLALSLHAPEDALRSELMPINDRYPLADVLQAARAFYERKRRRVFVEYVMLARVNDRHEQALALADLLSRESSRAGTNAQIFKINLIPYNPSEAPGERVFQGSSRESIENFRSVLAARGLPVTVRLTRGRDIHAACGQLAALAEPGMRATGERLPASVA